MEIPVEVARKLWKDDLAGFKCLAGYTHISCVAQFDHTDRLVLTPSCCKHCVDRGDCTASDLSPIRVSLVGPTETKTEMFGKYERLMVSCFQKAQVIVGKLDYDYDYALDDIAIALFQAKVGQIVTVNLGPNLGVIDTEGWENAVPG